MASTIKLKNGSGAPLAGDLVQGEPALDLTNKRLYTEDSLGNVIEVGINPTSVTTGNITSSGTVSVDTIAEKTAANGVVVDGVILKDGGITVTADVAFGDNDKATFGAGSDLQIYHNGSHSFIAEPSGTGNLYIGANNLYLSNGDVTEVYISAIQDGEVKLNYNNSVKLSTAATGIDVTGTVTADGLTVDSSGATYFNATVDGATGLTTLKSTNNSTGGSLKIQTGGSDRLQFAANGDISFYEDTGTTAKFFWDASTESLGIGTSSPSSFNSAADNLVVGTTSGDNGITIATGTANQGSLFFADGTASGAEEAAGYLIYVHSSNHMALGTGNTERMRIDSSGNVGIGTTSPNSYANFTTLTLDGTNGSEIDLEAAGTLRGQLYSTTSAVGLQTGSATNLPIVLGTNGAERVRIDASGNLLVGQTSQSPNTIGVSLNNNGNISAKRNDGVVAILNRGTSDGEILSIRKDNSTVGSIGSFNGGLLVGSPVGNDSHILFGDSFVGPATSTGAVRDAAIDVGTSSRRFKDLYLSGGVYLGGTGAANHLDDYEEGTWTPVVSDASTGGNTATYLANDGYYTKVGNLVQVTIYLVNINTTGMTSGNTVYIQGLPFSQVSVIDIGSIRVSSTTFSGNISIQADGASCSLPLSVSGSASSSLTVAGLSSGAADILATITYRTS